MPISSSSRVSAVRGGILAALAAAVLTACSGGATSGGSPANSATSSPVAVDTTAAPDGTTPAERPTEPSSPTGAPAPALPNPAPSSIPKVSRPGVSASASLSAETVPFSAPATYPDGVVVAVTKASKAVEIGQGPGAFAGRELVVLDIEIRNGSSTPISLDGVVITMYYGSTRQIASPVYASNVDVKDFGARVEAASSVSARYAFAVPAAELASMTTIVDFDSAHASAVFSGSVG